MDILKELLSFDASIPLQSLKVELFVAGMLIDDEEIVMQSGEDKAAIELTNYAHSFKVALA